MDYTSPCYTFKIKNKIKSFYTDILRTDIEKENYQLPWLNFCLFDFNKTRIFTIIMVFRVFKISSKNFFKVSLAINVR